jgi:hypothetical protein
LLAARRERACRLREGGATEGEGTKRKPRSADLSEQGEEEETEREMERETQAYFW